MNRRGSLFLSVLLGSLACWSQAAGRELSQDEAKKLKNPVPFSRASLARGRVLFPRTCATCHGTDGKAQLDVVADATDLTVPKGYKHGSSDGEIYRSIRDGAGANLQMPPFKSQFKEEDLWNLVNYIRSLGPDDQRPPLQPDDAKDTKKQ